MVASGIVIEPIWEASPFSIVVMDFDGDRSARKIVYVNPAFTELTGYSRAEAVGHSAALLEGAKTCPEKIDHAEAVLSKGSPYRAAVVHYRKDGSEYAARATTAPLFAPDGSAQFLILVETVVAPSQVGVAREAFRDEGRTDLPAIPAPLSEPPSGDLLRHLAALPELDDLQALWTKLRGDRKLPLRADFELPLVCRWAPHLSVTSVLPGGRFQFRLFGTGLARVYGRDLTGQFLDQLAPRDLWSVINLHYLQAVRTAQPLFAPISISNGRWHTDVSRLVLPLTSEGASGKVTAIMAADYPRRAVES